MTHAHGANPGDRRAGCRAAHARPVRVRRALRRMARLVPGAARRREAVAPLPPFLVGGTGRSGTTVTGRLLGSHPDYWMVPFEIRFHADRGGLLDVLAGRTGMDAFRHRMLGRWWLRGDGIGLATIIERRALRALLDRLERELDDDPWAAGRRFMHRLLDPPAIAAGARGWVEMTPPTVRVAPELLRMLPDARLVHSVRDGRDVAVSVAPLPWGPSDPVEAIDWWAGSLDAAFEAVGRAPSDRVLTVRMETLLRDDREAAYARLRAFAGLEDDPAMRAYFEHEATADRAHIGRWTRDLPAGRRAEFEARYAARAAELQARWGYEATEPTATIP